MTVRYLNDADAPVPNPAAAPDGDAGPDARAELGRYAEQGGFALAASPWYPAADALTSPEDARAASTLLAELRSRDLRATGAAVNSLAARAGLSVPDSITGLGQLVSILQRVQATAATLRAEAYDADLGALVAATADAPARKHQGIKLSWLRRRSLLSQARGLAVSRRIRRADLHAALTSAAAERADWSALATGDGRPAVLGAPQLLAETAEAMEALGRAVRELGRLLPGRDLAAAPLEELAELVDELAADEGTMFRLPALRTLRESLLGQGLADLLEQLTERQADRDAALAAYDRTFGEEDEAQAEDAALQALAAGPRETEETEAEEVAAVAEVEPVAEVEAEPVAEVEAVAVAEPEAEVEPELEAEVAAEPVAEEVTEVEPEPVAEPEAEVEAEPIAEAEVEAEAIAEVAAEPVAEEVTEVEPEPVAEPEAEVEAEPIAEAEVEAEAIAEVEAEVAAEPVAEEVTEVDPEPVAEPEAEPIAEVEAEVEVEVEAEPEVVAEAVIEAEPVAEPVAGVEPEVEPVVEPEVEAEAVEPEVIEPEVGEVAAGQAQKPEITPGRPVTAYTPEELTALVRWLDADGTGRSDDELLRAAMKELGFSRLGPRIKEALGAAIAEARG